jgi:hypothetical protein
MKTRFSLGQVVATQGVIALDLPLDTTLALLRRHQTGDWGEIGDEDRRENERSLRQGFRLMSVYTVNDTKIWIITEADRSSTTILLPCEY